MQIEKEGGSRGAPPQAPPEEGMCLAGCEKLRVGNITG